jgi:hypothetical protein
MRHEAEVVASPVARLLPVSVAVSPASVSQGAVAHEH